jgi:hypothetical protein
MGVMGGRVDMGKTLLRSKAMERMGSCADVAGKITGFYAFFRGFPRFYAQIRAVFTRFYAFLRVRPIFQ